MTLVVAGQIIVVFVACASDATGKAKSSRQGKIVPCAAASAGNENTSVPGKFDVVTRTGVAAAVSSAAANLLIARYVR
jgi:hypothetical protein